jgi:cytochrome c556
MRTLLLTLTHFRAIAVLSLAGLVTACSPAHRDVPAKDVPSLGSLEDVMQVQATVADPWFAKASAKTFTDADFTTLADVGDRIQATGARTKSFSKGPAFDALADRLGGTGKQLAEAAARKDAAGASVALVAMKATCKECHSAFR